MLKALRCPPGVLDLAVRYLKICFFGMIPQLIYNSGNAILRSLGNTAATLRFLLISSMSNLVLDLLLVVGAGKGLEGAAWATVLAQGMLAFLILWKMGTMDSSYRLSFRQKMLTIQKQKELFALGIPSGMQAVFMSISSLVIQISINQCGAAAVAGMTVFAKVEGFLYYPAFSYGMALTGFIGQNLGAGKTERVEKAMKTSVKLAVGFTVPTSALLMFLSKILLLGFTKDPAILANGQEAIFFIFPFYFLYSINQVYIGGLKGLGNSTYPMLCSLLCYCVFRVLWCWLLLPFVKSMVVIYTCYDASWILMLPLLMLRYYSVYRAYEEKRGGLLEKYS